MTPSRRGHFRVATADESGIQEGIMGRKTLNLALLMALPLAGGALACGDDRDRQALTDEELEREVDLAFFVDTVAPTFQDTVAGVAPTPPAAEPVPTPAPARTAAPRAQAPAPARAPQRAEPMPRPEPWTIQPRPQPAALSVPAGTRLALRLNDELSTERSRAGDAFTATLSEPLLDAAGAVLVPAGATVRGRVTAVSPSGRIGETAALRLAFEAISFGGQTYPMQASVERADVQQRTRTSAAEQAGKVAAGAAAGAVLGRVIGGDRGSTIRGAAIGAAAGTAIAMGTADVDAVLPEGAAVLIRLDGPIQMTRTVTSGT
jgi:hypothetical protein